MKDPTLCKSWDSFAPMRADDLMRTDTLCSTRVVEALPHHEQRAGHGRSGTILRLRLFGYADDRWEGGKGIQAVRRKTRDAIFCFFIVGDRRHGPTQSPLRLPSRRVEYRNRTRQPGESLRCDGRLACAELGRASLTNGSILVRDAGLLERRHARMIGRGEPDEPHGGGGTGALAEAKSEIQQRLT